MGLSIGIIGLPNVGKSTTFNALTRTQNARVSNYPFCTIEPNRAVVPVPDPRLDRLGELTGRQRIIHTTIEFVDIAGLVKGASEGEGLGNQFLGHVRNTDALVHVVRCFEDPNVVHISEHPDPVVDIEIVNTELMLADLQQLIRKIERLTRQVKGDRRYRPLLEIAQALEAHLDGGQPISAFPDRHSEAFQSLNREMRFLTAKPVIYAANVDESGLAEDNELVLAVRQVAQEQGAEVVKLCARLEEELADLTTEERQEFLALAGVQESALDQIIQRCYRILGLISFFTMNEEEVRAWAVPDGTNAVTAAGVIHTDFARGFIRAEVIPFEVFVRHGSVAATRAAGEMRLEGKQYAVQDGDLIYVRFNI